MLTIGKFLLRKRTTCCALCVLGLLSQPLFGAQQTKEVAPAAPVPVSIATAKRVFIANAPGNSLAASLGGPSRAYNEFYAAMKSWGHYELASAPADADLVLEISFENPITGVNVMSTSGGGSSSDLLLKLVIVDPKSRVPLWWFSESFALKGGISHRKETLSSNFDRSIGNLVDDVKRLVSASTAASDQPMREFLGPKFEVAGEDVALEHRPGFAIGTPHDPGANTKSRC